MKIKFIIAKAGANSYWSYYGGPKTPTKEYPNYIIDRLNDCFLNGAIKDAIQFDSYEEAETEIKSWGNMVDLKKTKDSNVHVHIGIGIYKIEKIFIHELPA